MRNPFRAVGAILLAALTVGARPATEPATMPAAAGQTWTNSIGMSFAYIPAGEFLMGSPADDPERQDGETQHRVTLGKPFLMGVFLVTQGQWRMVMGNNPSWFGWIGDDNVPVDNVSWNDAVAFCKKLSRMDDKHYHLPTEAQWEYACRAGTTESREALADEGWYDDNSAVRTHAVGQKKPNAWGLYDMHGNVWEWCFDWYADYPAQDATDPTGPDHGWARAMRGGSWYSQAPYCRSACRGSNAPDHRGFGIGVRICLDVP